MIELKKQKKENPETIRKHLRETVKTIREEKDFKPLSNAEVNKEVERRRLGNDVC